MSKTEHMSVKLKGPNKEELQHFKVRLILLVTMIIVIQVVLIKWKKRHFISFQIATSFALWIVPFIMCVRMSYWRFIAFWALFSLITGIVVLKAKENPLQGTTPRLVYKWFYFIYRLSYILGIFGYFMILSGLYGFSAIINIQPTVWRDLGFSIIYYGLYFGVLGQDVAQLCTSRMAASLGYYSKQGFPTKVLNTNICAVCGNKILVDTDDGNIESTFKLSCTHIFHEFCIRGWCIVGKKQTCPYCKEIVDFKRMFCNPWEKPHILYGKLLDWLRWLVAWGPVMMSILYYIDYAYTKTEELV